MKKLISVMVIACLLLASVSVSALSITVVPGGGQEAIDTYKKYGQEVGSAIVNLQHATDMLGRQRAASETVSEGIFQAVADRIYQLLDVPGGRDLRTIPEVKETVLEIERYLEGLSDTFTIDIALDHLKRELGMLQTGPNASVNVIRSYSDITKLYWAYEYIMTMTREGAISGVEEPVNGVGVFDGMASVSLGQFLTIATRLVAADKIISNNSGHWAVPYYNAAVASGLISASEFSCTPQLLDAPISREDMAYILVNVAKANGEELSANTELIKYIPDYHRVSDKRKNDVLKAYTNELLVGDNYGRFMPAKDLNRGEAAAVFCRVMNFTERPEGVPLDSYQIVKGENTGLLYARYSRYYQMEAFKSVFVEEDEGGVYVRFTAPELPPEIKDKFHFRLYVGTSRDGGFYVSTGVNCYVKSGESIKIYDEDAFVEGKSITADMFDFMEVYITLEPFVEVPAVRSYLHGHRAIITVQDMLFENWHDGYGAALEYDCSHVFAGLGK